MSCPRRRPQADQATALPEERLYMQFLPKLSKERKGDLFSSAPSGRQMDLHPLAKAEAGGLAGALACVIARGGYLC